MATQSRLTTKEARKALTRPRKRSNAQALLRLSELSSAPLPAVEKEQRLAESVAPQAGPAQFFFRAKTTSSFRWVRSSRFDRLGQGKDFHRPINMTGWTSI